MDEPRFELISKVRDASGVIRIRYGSGPLDPMPFVLTLTPQYVAREIGKTLGRAVPAIAGQDAADPLELAPPSRYKPQHRDTPL